MKAGKPHRYVGEEILVTWERKRCIHAAECVRGLPAVFRPGSRPWVDPSKASADTLAEVVQRCPTGALQYEGHGGSEEPVPGQNLLRLQRNGPLYLAGDLELVTSDEEPARETRVALCRCGASENKPFCDNSHLDSGFGDEGSLGESRLGPGEDEPGRLRISPVPNGPLLLEGPVTLESASGVSRSMNGRVVLCRCGASANKPYCDSSHVAIGFEAE
jgi:CDGSH-type Zn-finger protein/uncharacterized Fe-S cluster protein YjdI